jgi:alpha-ketoglutarate-dependent taurine dioxygenase
MATELCTVAVDAAAVGTAAEFDEQVRRPWLESGVLLLRTRAQPSLTPAQLVGFSRYLGELDIHVAEQFLLPEQREILQVTNRTKPDGSALGFAEAGRYWVRLHVRLSLWSRTAYCRRPLLWRPAPAAL